MARHRNAAEIWYEGDDGWWALLKPGLQFDGCHCIHADETLSKREGLLDLYSLLDMASPCICEECCPQHNPLEGVWVKGHRFNKRKFDHDMFFAIPLELFMQLRAAYETELNIHKRKFRENWWFGFLPSTFARKILSNFGILEQRELDLPYAIYQHVRVAEGLWEEGPPKTGWRTLPNLLEH